MTYIAVIAKAQGGRLRGGFWSGFAASLFSPGTTLGGEGAEGFTLRTTIAAVVGGTASELGGGKFANGAVSGAFVHMFNAEARNLFFRNVVDHNIEEIRKIKAKYGDMAAKIYFYNKVKPKGDWDYKRQPLYKDNIGEMLGNFNYGAVGRVVGFGMDTLLRAGGFVSEYFGTYKDEYGHFYDYYPYGDDPRDQQMIMKGYYYAK